MRVIISIILVLSGCFVFGQNINFYKQYSEQGYDYGQGVVQLEDSSYVVTGSSSSFTGYQSQAFLIKVDSMGNFKWSNHYGGMESEWGRRVLYKQGFGFFVAGFTNSIGNGVYDYYLVKTDLNGQMEWEKSYGDFGWEKVNDAALTRDTGVVMVGETSSNVTNNKDIYIVRTDKNGDTLWTKTIGGAGDDWAMSIKAYEDSNFMIVGSVYDEDSLHNRGYMMKFHEDGTVLWSDTIHISGNMEFNDFLISNDSLRIVGTHYQDVDSLDIMTLSYDIPNSNVFTLDTLNTDGDKEGVGIIKRTTPNPYYIGYHMQNAGTYPGGYDGKVGMYNPGLWHITNVVQISHNNPDIIGQLINTSDGGFMVVGYTSSDGMGAGNIFLCKVAPDNTTPPILDVTSVYNFVGVEEVTEIVGLSIYPNPAYNEVTFSSESSELIKFELIDLFGKKYQQGSFFTTNTLDITGLNSGVYILKMSTPSGGVSNSKLIIK